jgi:hypothetical protein
MLRAILFTALICLTASALCAQSQHPAPTPGKQSKPVQEKANATTQEPYADQRGTEQSPLVVKTIQPPKTQEEIDREKADHDEKAANDRRVIDYTGALADYTRALAWLTGGLVIVALFQFGVLIYQVRLFGKSAAAAQLAADSARKSADATIETVDAIQAQVRTMQAQDTAYLFVKVRAFNRDWRFDQGDNPGQIIVKNHGKTPAILMKISDVSGVFQGFPDADSWIDRNIIPETIINPGEDELLSVNFRIGENQLQSVIDGGYPLVSLGCIYYEDVFGNERKTGFCWQYDYWQNELQPIDDKKYNYRT